MAYFTETLRVRRPNVEPPTTVAAGAPVSRMPRLGTGVLRNLSGNPDTGACGMQWSGWNGDRARGWGFYCQCGFCTPMTRSFSEGLDLLERHWQKSGGHA